MFFKKKEQRLESALDNEGPLNSWERSLVERVVTTSLSESRRTRRWGIFFKSLTFIYLFALLWLFFPDKVSDTVKSSEEHTALVDIKGVIAPETKASADKIVEGLRDAYEDKKTKGIILRINSPGGSPVQAGYVYNEIRRLRKKHEDIPVYAVIADIGASGAYYIAAATDAIYADKASIVGSIGVLMNGFGFVDTLEDLGVERRLLTAGDNKAIMDPFSPMRDQDKIFIKQLLDKLHAQFIAAVKDGRKDKLQDDPDIFSGLFWSGEDSVELGLVDGLSSSGQVARDVIGVEKIVDFTSKEDWLKRFSDQMGVSIANALGNAYGLDARPMLK
jgi:protease-4